MLFLPGYRIDEMLYTTSHSIVYRGQREKGHTPVILKVLNKSYPTPVEQARFQHEYMLTRQFGGTGIIHALDMLQHQHSPVMVLEDIGGIPLKHAQAEHRLSLGEKIAIAIQITQALATLHDHGVMHKDINPTNIVRNPTTGQLKLIDLGLATVLSREQPEVRHPEELEGTLSYLSPEQTGRMNRAMDYRTDFYSLGVTFYELLTGKLPFDSKDPLELIHAHIARPPLPPQSLDATIPAPLSDIVLKLLAKTAEERYQSAYGLLADLELVQRQWLETGTVDAFLLGQNDMSPRFALPQRLYGREAALAALLATFERVSQGATELVLVAGYAGVGKSALINELHEPIVRQRGYFIAGKFDKFQRNVPYSALIQAFRTLIHRLLTESAAQVNGWRDRLLAALGPNGQVIIEVIPEVELLIGAQPGVPELGPTENQNRFQFVFQNFISVFAQSAHPLVLFLDDLQWAESASLNLLHLFLVDPERKYLLVLGAYRDSEIEADHPLHRLRRELAEAQVLVTDLAVTPLDQAQVTHFVADTVHCPLERAQPLAEVLFTKTQGNPFFLGELLKTLYQEGLLTFVPPGQAQQSAEWVWELARVEAHAITDNVVELMRGKLQQLPEETQTVLRVAALLGNQFELVTLAQVQEISPAQIATMLWPALQAGLLIPQGQDYRLLQSSAPETLELGAVLDVSYTFSHDQVRQAAYELLPQSERPALHLRVGRLLLASHQGSDQEEHLFEIVDHLNTGQHLLSDSAEREQLTHLNLRAGQKAKSSAAYEPAAQYIQMALSLLPPGHWQSHYDLSLSLYKVAAEIAFLRGEFEQMTVVAQEVLRHARTTLDQVPFRELLIQATVVARKLEESLKQSSEALSLLGMVTLPHKPTLFQVIVAFLHTRFLLGRRSPEALLSLPPMTDPHARATMRLLVAASGPAYSSNPQLLAIIVSQMVQLSLKYGNARSSAYGYAGYGLLLCAQGNIQLGYDFGQLARALTEQKEMKELRGKTLWVVSGFLQHWKTHLRQLDMVGNHQACLEEGDFLFAGFAAGSQVRQLFLIGYPLAQTLAQAEEYAMSLRRQHQSVGLINLQIIQQILFGLLGEPSPFDEEETLRQVEQAQDRTNLSLIHHGKTLLNYHFGNYEAAAAHALISGKYVQGLAASMYLPAFYLYHSLALLARSPDAAPADQKHFLKQVAANQKKLAAWAKHGPMNCLHKYELVEAERARLRGDHAQVITHYQRAIELAHETDYPQEEALANERAGSYYLERGMVHVAEGYLRDARQGYVVWGANAKVRWMEQQYATLLAAPVEPPTGESQGLSTSNSSTRSGQQIDLATVVKASQAISSEIDLDRLLEKLLHTVMENAGAEKGVLLLVEGGELHVEAEGRVTPPEVRLLHAQPLEESTLLSTAIVHYIERTQQDVVLDDAAQEGLFSNDPYIRRQRPHSILATPLLNQGTLMGVLYLENNLTTGAFTPARVEMVRLLGTQAAISITNAQAIAARSAQERLHLEKLLLEQRAQDLAELNQSKDKFFSIISHDLRSPFNALLGLSQLMQKYATTLTQAEVENYSGRIYNSGRQVLALLDNLLQWAQIQTGHISFTPERLDLREVVAYALVVLNESATFKEIVLLNEVPPATPVHADANMLDTVLRNLISNALKFTHAGGQVRVQATAHNLMIEVAVADTGVGMSEEAAQKLFRIDVTHTTQGTAQEKGTGLVLVLCKELVEKQGGAIRVESTPGEGTTFYFTLPQPTP
ncbi:MAG: AAA family ATPase [Ardenticatenales bacterium]|nr:AAA family ATPase [Ardenticatenales bacterium]